MTGEHITNGTELGCGTEYDITSGTERNGTVQNRRDRAGLRDRRGGQDTGDKAGYGTEQSGQDRTQQTMGQNNRDRTGHRDTANYGTGQAREERIRGTKQTMGQDRTRGTKQTTGQDKRDRAGGGC